MACSTVWRARAVVAGGIKGGAAANERCARPSPSRSSATVRAMDRFPGGCSPAITRPIVQGQGGADGNGTTISPHEITQRRYTGGSRWHPATKRDGPRADPPVEILDALDAHR